MQYVTCDIHGCYEKYMALLDKIRFSRSDCLYVLGDVLDRGEAPIRVLRDMMVRHNVYPLLGNHEYMALTVLSRLNVEITEENADSYLTADDLMSYSYWLQDGGETTVRDFLRLSPEEREAVLDYLRDFSLYEVARASGKRFVLVHADIHGFDEQKALSAYRYSDFIFHRADYGRRYYTDANTFLVTGHTPTLAIREDGLPLVYEENGHIALDCGCVYGGRLAAYCLETGEAVYV